MGRVQIKELKVTSLYYLIPQGKPHTLTTLCKKSTLSNPFPLIYKVVPPTKLV